MALSDRIALLRNGTLEQVASPREIYAHPATAYTAQFIGQTNFLRGEVHDDIAKCGALHWPTQDADGPAFSRCARKPSDSPPTAATRHDMLFAFAPRSQQQIYAGATELLK